MKIHSDDRGTLYEIPNCGGTQFISRSNVGVRRGDHYHLHKTEYFLVLSGDAILYTRSLVTGEKHNQVLHGGQPQLVEIRPLITHAIENVGATELVLLVQSDTVFDQNDPDTYSEAV